RAPLLVDRDDLTIEEQLVGTCFPHSSRDGRELAGGVFQIAGVELDARAVLQGEGAISVPLHLVGPLLPDREFGRGSHHHGGDRSEAHSGTVPPISPYPQYSYADIARPLDHRFLLFSSPAEGPPS